MSRSPGGLRLATESVAGQRPHQEDAVLGETLSDGRTLVAVADGMGGHAAGEVASTVALESLVEGLDEGRSLREAFVLANERVHAAASEPGKRGMGTTLVAMILDGESYELANVGDSRAYLLSGQGIRQITRDHSFVAEAIDRGTPREEAEASKWRDALTRSIGTDAEVEVDAFGPFDVEKGTAVLLCSDGLYKVVSDAVVEEVVIRSGGPEGAARALVAAALERGSDDNITVAIAEFGELPRQRPGETQEMRWEAPDRAGEEPEGAGAGVPPALHRMPRWLIGAVVAVLVAALIGVALALG